MDKEYIPRSPRYPAKFNVMLHGKQGVPILGQAKDISLSGILLAPDKYDAPIFPGADMCLEVYLSEDDHIKSYKIPLRVARHNRKEVGMAVDASDEKALNALRSLVLHEIKGEYWD